jgi:hypothetical protein
VRRQGLSAAASGDGSSSEGSRGAGTVFCVVIPRLGRSPFLGSQVGEDDPALPAGEAPLGDAGPVRLEGEALRSRQLAPL